MFRVMPQQDHPISYLNTKFDSNSIDITSGEYLPLKFTMYNELNDIVEDVAKYFFNTSEFIEHHQYNLKINVITTTTSSNMIK
ncbi:hypothetical protein U3516DRAFT_747947 [Neocallimastix sp. 'constans']